MGYLIPTVIVTVILNRMYHKMFRVTYFSLQAVIFEWLACFIISTWIVGGLLGSIL